MGSKVMMQGATVSKLLKQTTTDFAEGNVTQLMQMHWIYKL